MDSPLKLSDSLDKAMNAAWWNANFMWHGLKGPYEIGWDYFDKHRLNITIRVEVECG